MGLEKPKIVAIDDEVDFTAMLREYFEPRGYDVSVANHGVNGIELIKSKKPDIVLLDLKMPGISGDEVMSLAKKVQPTSKVIFVTAYDDAGRTRERLLKSGAYAYMDKPLPSLKLLEDKVNEAFGEILKERAS